MITPTQSLTVTRDYKSRMFTMIFHEKRELLELYNAVSGKNYKDPEQLIITTLDNAIYMSMKNDVSFIIHSQLSLYEHQSTYNPNMPLRFFLYLADVYSTLIIGKNLYGKKKVQIPAPKFIVFYNGTDERADYEELKLSDLYIAQDEDIALELKVVMLNINLGHNRELLESCKTLHDYAEYTFRVRKYAKSMPIEEAVEKAIVECIQENILHEFLERHRAEAKAMSIYEYNEEEHMRMEREESYAEGIAEGRAEGIAEGIAEAVRRMLKNGCSYENIASLLEMDVEKVKQIEKESV